MTHASLGLIFIFFFYFLFQDKHRQEESMEQQLGATFEPTVESLLKSCDVVTINCPLHPETENLINEKTIKYFKRGAYLINTARAKIVDRDVIVRALDSGQLSGYAGDVWFPQPAPPDHPWRSMPNHAMTVHYSGATLDAQARYSAGVQQVLECWLNGKDIPENYLIVDRGLLVSTSYTEGDATTGVEKS